MKEIIKYVPMCQVVLRDGRVFLIRLGDRERVEQLWAERKPVRLEGHTVNSMLIDSISEVKENDLTVRLTWGQRQQLNLKKKWHLDNLGRAAKEEHIQKWAERLLSGEDLTF